MKKMFVIKFFWKTAKSFLSDKIVSKEQILLVENDEIISEDCKIAESLNSFFSDIVKFLNTSPVTILYSKMFPIRFLT